MRFCAATSEEMERLGAALAQHCKLGDCITLTGDLGVGKTVFARGFIRAMHPDAEVTSPTFTLIHSYDGTVPLHHIDLYRIENAAELEELGLAELLETGICLIEWPQIAMHLLPQETLHLAITSGKDGLRSIEAAGDAWQARLEGDKA